MREDSTFRRLQTVQYGLGRSLEVAGKESREEFEMHRKARSQKTLKSYETNISLKLSNLSTVMGQDNNKSRLSWGGYLTIRCKHTQTHTRNITHILCASQVLDYCMVTSVLYPSACNCCHMQNSM